MTSIAITADRSAAGKPLDHAWSRCVGAGRANEGLRAGWLEQLALVRRDCGFQYLRFHGLFHDDMFVLREKDGKHVLNWQYIDDLFDRMLALGVRPFVELGFCPGPLARRLGSCFWWKGHGAPPKDHAAWAALVEAFVRHCIARYGRDEVRSWYFEVWNEPNLDFFFGGTRSEYFELYRTSVQAVKKVDPALRVGGPSTSNFVMDGRNDGESEAPPEQRKRAVLDQATIDGYEFRPVWIREFLAFCARERLPVDFVSTHPYPTDFPLDGHGNCARLSRRLSATAEDCRLVREIVRASAFPDAEVHCTEWNSSPSPRDFGHDVLPAAAFIIRANLDAGPWTDSLSYWTFTDVFEENGAGDTMFHGGFGLVNYQGLPKPAFHAYRLLNTLGGDELARSSGAIATRCADGRLSVLASHYPPEEPRSVPMLDRLGEAEALAATGSPAQLEIVLTGLAPGAAVLVETLDRANGDVLAAWRAMGSPEPATRAQTALLREAALATRKEFLCADAQGRLEVARTMSPWSVVSVREIG